jgi:Cu2+-exporting ATPase
MRDAMAQRPALAVSADRWAAPFLVAVLLLAAGAAAAWAVIDPARAVWVAVSVLIVTCPCALSLAAPSALLAASGRLARHGVLLRSPDALDAMARVRTLFIDKTGTLTEAQPRWRGLQRVADLRAGDGDDDAALLRAAAALAAWSNHPLSRALAAQAGATPAAWHDVRELPAAGIAATDGDGRAWRLGTAAFVGAPPADADAADTLSLWFGLAGTPLLRFDFDEVPRRDAAAAVAALQASGIELRLLSGDRAARVRRLAAQLGIASVQADATPQDKLAAVRAAQAAGQVVAMLGDGINDAPVLAQADVSLAMGGGADLARHSADALLLSMQLADVVHAFALARRTRRIVLQNFAWAAGYNAACIPLALAGWLPPWLAGLGMALSSMVVVGNALRLAK